MDASVNVTKSWLENAPLYKYHVVGGQIKTKEAAVLWLEQFSNVKSYSITIKCKDWNFTVTRKVGYLEVAGTAAKYYQKIDCFVVNSEEEISELFPAKMFSGKKYKFEIPLEFITCIDKGLPSNYNLFLMIRVMHDFYMPLEMNTLYRNSSRYQQCSDFSGCLERLLHPITYEEEEISSNLSYTFEQNCFTDFVIIAQKRKIHVHKSILASRSTFFRDHIRNSCGDEENKMRLDAGYKSVIAVVRFLYTGCLEVKSPEEMQEVFGLAEKLKLSSLRNLYLFRSWRTHFEKTGSAPTDYAIYAQSVMQHVLKENATSPSRNSKRKVPLRIQNEKLKPFQEREKA